MDGERQECGAGDVDLWMKGGKEREEYGGGDDVSIRSDDTVRGRNRAVRYCTFHYFPL